MKKMKKFNFEAFEDFVEDFNKFSFRPYEKSEECLPIREVNFSAPFARYYKEAEQLITEVDTEVDLWITSNIGNFSYSLRFYEAKSDKTAEFNLELSKGVFCLTELKINESRYNSFAQNEKGNLVSFIILMLQRAIFKNYETGMLQSSDIKIVFSPLTDFDKTILEKYVMFDSLSINGKELCSLLDLSFQEFALSTNPPFNLHSKVQYLFVYDEEIKSSFLNKIANATV